MLKASSPSPATIERCAARWTAATRPISRPFLFAPNSRPLVNPQAGLAFDLEGPDSHAIILRPAPRVDGAENSAEMAELYWMALARDVPFESGSDPTIGVAARPVRLRLPRAEDRRPGDARRRSSAAAPAATSQDPSLAVPAARLPLRLAHREPAPADGPPGIDYLTDFASWLAVQNGGPAGGPTRFDPTPRYIRSLRDLGQYVHVDALYEAYLNACLILLELGVPLDPASRHASTDAGGLRGRSAARTS